MHFRGKFSFFVFCLFVCLFVCYTNIDFTHSADSSGSTAAAFAIINKLGSILLLKGVPISGSEGYGGRGVTGNERCLVTFSQAFPVGRVTSKNPLPFASHVHKSRTSWRGGEVLLMPSSARPEVAAAG